MKRSKIAFLGMLVSLLLLLPIAVARPTWDRVPTAFVHGAVITIDGEQYYFAGPGSAPNAVDIPGHVWLQTGPDRFLGKHYNVGPFIPSLGNYVPTWWASQEPDGALLFNVEGIIAPWSPEIAEQMASDGFVHYHEFVSVKTGNAHPTLVPWLKHTASSFFFFDSTPMPQFAHYVSPGVDYEFMPNYLKPYNP